MMHTASASFMIGLLFAVSPAFGQAAKLLEKHNDWSVFVHETQDQKVCFATSTPKDTEPKGVNRGSIYFYLTTWQKEGVRNEVSVKVGYPLKEDSTPTVKVGDSEFELYPKDDKAFMRDPADERRLLDAMIKGSSMEVTGTSSRGTATVDKYSLAGVTAAVRQIEQACP